MAAAAVDLVRCWLRRRPDIGPVGACDGQPDAVTPLEAPGCAVDLDGQFVDLAGYKRLRHVLVVDAVPRLASGKVLRRTLHDEWEPRLLGAAAGA